MQVERRTGQDIDTIKKSCKDSMVIFIQLLFQLFPCIQIHIKWKRTVLYVWLLTPSYLSPFAFPHIDSYTNVEQSWSSV